MTTNTEPTQGETLPCPFCGGEGLTHRVPTGWRVSCKNCDAQPRPGFPSKSEVEAITAWNARASTQPRGDAVEIADQLSKALVERDENRFKTVAFVHRHGILAALQSPQPGGEAERDPEDMQAVGNSLMDAIEKDFADHPFMKGWHPADCPTEIVGDLLNALDEAKGQLAQPSLPSACR